MPIIVGIRFKEAGKVYYFDPGELEMAQGDWAVVETAQGKECGLVTLSPHEVPDDQIVSPLKKVTRKATSEDMKIVEERAGKEKHALEVCEEKVRAHNLEMKLVDVEYAFDGNKIIFYFTADGRVDFRALVRDLAAVFRTRIELRQIGVRDEVKMLGGLGPCGREACCRTFLKDFSPVSIRMAKDQNLSLNPTKISGLCGRLMCCLNYEQENYAATLQLCPKRGVTVLTPEGPATVEDVLILKEKAKVRLTGEEVEFREYPFTEIKEAGQKDIAEWEASGGRARAVLAKVAYKEALNKPKPKPEDLPMEHSYFGYSDEQEPEEEQAAFASAEKEAAREPMVSAASVVYGAEDGQEDAEPDDSFEDEDEFDADEPDDEEPEDLEPGEPARSEPVKRPALNERGSISTRPPQPRPVQNNMQNQPRQPQNQPTRQQPQNPGQNPGQSQPQGAGGQEVHRRRHRGGRRRGGFHGGPKV